MLKLVLYLGLTFVGIVGALFSPLIGAIASVEAYLLNPAIFELPGNVRYQQWATLAFLAGVVIHSLRPRLKPVGHEVRLIVCFWIFLLIASITSLFAEVSVSLAFNDLFEVFKTVLVATFLVRALQSQKDLRIFLIACVIGVLHAAVLHVLGPKFGYLPMSHSREFGVLPDDQTPVMVIFIPLLMVIAATGPGKLERVLAFCALPMAIDSVVNSFQRTGFVALAVEAVVLVFFGGWNILKRLVPIGIVAAILFFARFTPDNYWAWVETIQDPMHEGSAHSRFVINEISLRMLKDHPLGVGYRNYLVVSPRYLPPEYVTEQGTRSAHNSFLSIACETGIPGLIFWIAPFIGALVLLRRVRKRPNTELPFSLAPYALGLEVGLYGWFATGLTLAEHELDPAYWFVALAIVLVRVNQPTQSAESQGTVTAFQYSPPMTQLPTAARTAVAAASRVRARWVGPAAK